MQIKPLTWAGGKGADKSAGKGTAKGAADEGADKGTAKGAADKGADKGTAKRADKGSDEGTKGSLPCKVSKAQLVLKWGGELTKQGRIIVQEDGESFREECYENALAQGTAAGTGLLRSAHHTVPHPFLIVACPVF